jgi:DNA-binding Lrp family transcriptional regulator
MGTMDEIDLRAYQLLFTNGRLTYRELGDELGVNIPTVHRRIQDLIGEGIFTKFYANISLGYLNAVTAQITGVSRCKPLGPQIISLLKKDYIERVLLFGSNLVAVTMLLPRYEDIGLAVEYICNTLRLQDFHVMLPTVVATGSVPIYSRYVGEKELTPLDYKIIFALHDDSRRPLVEVAEELQISVKTVKSHLDKMIESGAIEFGADWVPERSSGIPSVVKVEFKPEVDKGAFITELNEAYGPKVILTIQYYNRPDLVVANCWFPTMDEHVEFIRKVEMKEGVKEVDSRVIQSTHLYETWRDRVLRERAEAGIRTY